MTHNEERTHWWKEAIFGTITGIGYGIVQVVFCHPFDTVKTKMQAQEEYNKTTFKGTSKNIFRKDGITGFYKGGVSILLGNSLFRGVQFSVFEGVHSRFDKKNLKQKNYEKLFTHVIPFTFGLEMRTVIAGVMSGVCRSLVECPFEYVKIRRQVDFKFSYRNIYHGLIPLTIKNSPMVCIGFCLIDIFRRNTNAWNSSLGIFFATGFSTVLCNLIVWPLEIFKTFYMAKSSGEIKNIKHVILDIVNNHGIFKGVFRGALPGIITIFLRNGIGYTLSDKIQKFITYLELRK
jgi:hypothetical protein